MIEFTDRYSALGIDRPAPATVCRGYCEGTGVVPCNPNTAHAVLAGPLFQAWKEAHAKPHSSPCDGWHFVQCPECFGTGKRPA